MPLQPNSQVLALTSDPGLVRSLRESLQTLGAEIQITRDLPAAAADTSYRMAVIDTRSVVDFSAKTLWDLRKSTRTAVQLVLVQHGEWDRLGECIRADPACRVVDFPLRRQALSQLTYSPKTRTWVLLLRN